MKYTVRVIPNEQTNQHRANIQPKNQKLLKTGCNNVVGATLFNVVNNIVRHLIAPDCWLIQAQQYFCMCAINIGFDKQATCRLSYSLNLAIERSCSRAFLTTELTDHKTVRKFEKLK